jgi:heat shock protein HslJ
MNITAPFVNASWRWIARAGSESYSVPSPDRYTIKFNTTGTYAIRADCNNGTGNFTVNATKLKISPPTMATKTYCGDASLDRKYIAALGQVTSYQVDASGRLVLIMVNQNERLTFTKVV